MPSPNQDNAATTDRRRFNRLIKDLVPPGAMKALSRLLPSFAKRMINAVIASDFVGRFEKGLEQRSVETQKKSARTVSADELRQDLAAIALPAESALFVHTSLSKLGFIEGGAATVAEILKELVVDRWEGTLAMPAFSMKGTMYDAMISADQFDVRNTPSGMGKITEVFRTMPGVRRSLHPTHSVCALGPRAQWLTADHHRSEKSFGETSPLGRMLECGGYLMGLGTDLGPVTFYHVLEDLQPGFPFRVYTTDSPIETICRDWNGEAQKVRAMAHDSQVSAVRIDKPTGVWIRQYVTDYMERRHGLKWIKVGDGKAWIIALPQFYEGLVELMKQGITIYSTEEDVAALEGAVA